MNDEPPWYDDAIPGVGVTGDGRVHVVWYDRRDAVGCPSIVSTYRSWSDDGGRTYRERIRQEFNFSPGTSFEREEWSMPAERVTHVRIVIQPDKGNAPRRATLTSLTVR